MEALQEAEKKIEILESEAIRKDKEISVLREHLRSHRKSIYTLSEQAEKSDCLIKQLEDRIARYEEMEKQYEILKKVIDYSVTVLEGALN